MLPASTCARSGAALHSNTTRLASTSNGARPNKAEKAFPFIAFPPGPRGPQFVTNPGLQRQGGQSRLKHSSTYLNFADRSLAETRGNAPNDMSVLRIWHPKPDTVNPGYSGFTHPNHLTA